MKQSTKNLIRGVGVTAIMSLPVASLAIGTFKAFKPMIDRVSVQSPVPKNQGKPEMNGKSAVAANVQSFASTVDPFGVGAEVLGLLTIPALVVYRRLRLNAPPAYPPLETRMAGQKGDIQ